MLKSALIRAIRVQRSFPETQVCLDNANGHSQDEAFIP
jgi:hypothetical protein